MIKRENIQDIYGLSAMQESMLLNYALDAESEAYVEQFEFDVKGSFNIERLKKALNLVSKKYDVLRTIFSYNKTDKSKQIVLKEWNPELNFEDYSECENKNELVKEYVLKDKRKKFDLSKDVLIRYGLMFND